MSGRNWAAKLLHGDVSDHPLLVHTLIRELSSHCDVAYTHYTDPTLVNATYCFLLSP